MELTFQIVEFSDLMRYSSLVLSFPSPLGDRECALVSLKGGLQLKLDKFLCLFDINFDELLADKLNHISPKFFLLERGGIIEGSF